MYGIFIALTVSDATTPSAQNGYVHLELTKDYSTARRYNQYFLDEIPR